MEPRPAATRAVRAWAKSCTSAQTEAQSGYGTLVQVLPDFTAPALPVGTVAVLPGALKRIFAQIAIIKKSGKLTDDIAADLGIVGTEAAGPDMCAFQPVLTLVIIGNQVLVKWSWLGYSAWLSSCEIEVDRNDGKGNVLLTIDTTPNYTDTHPFPTAATVWTYRAIFHSGDGVVGIWSQSVSINVGG